MIEQALEDIMESGTRLKPVCLCSKSDRKVNENDIVGNSRYFGWLRCGNCKKYFSLEHAFRNSI